MVRGRGGLLLQVKEDSMSAYVFIGQIFIGIIHDLTFHMQTIRS
jgi:hypothetical protein